MIDFFQTINVKQFIFADCDNASQPNKFIDFLIDNNLLTIHSQIICFIGPNQNQNNWYTNAVKYISKKNKTAYNLTPIRVYTTGKNAVDMVLSSYVGLSMAKNPTSKFIIVSNDTDYTSVIDHFKMLGVDIEIKKLNNPVEKNTKLDSSIAPDTVKELVSCIKGPINKRPKSIKKLKNTLINSSCTKFKTLKNQDEYVEKVLQELIKTHKITLDNDKIKWTK